MLQKAKEMAVYSPAHGVLDPKGPLSHTIPLNVIVEVNKEVKNTWFVPILYGRGEGLSSEVREHQRSQSNSP